MNEADYLLATNLAKLRVANHVLRDVLFMDEAEKAELTKAIRVVSDLCDSLYAQLKERK